MARRPSHPSTRTRVACTPACTARECGCTCPYPLLWVWALQAHGYAISLSAHVTKTGFWTRVTKQEPTAAEPAPANAYDARLRKIEQDIALLQQMAGGLGDEMKLPMAADARLRGVSAGSLLRPSVSTSVAETAYYTPYYVATAADIGLGQLSIGSLAD
jgi:hypothetical protein